MITAFLISTIVGRQAISVPIRVDGEGYIRIAVDGRAAYVKEATLVVKGDRVVTDFGAQLLPSVAARAPIEGLEVDLEGRLYSLQQGRKGLLGRLVLAMFSSDSSLSLNGRYFVSAERPTLANPGEGLAGVIRVIGQTPTGAFHRSGTVTAIKQQSKPAIESKSKPQAPIGQPNLSSPKPAAQARDSMPLKSMMKVATLITVRERSIAANRTFTLGEIAEVEASPELLERLRAVVIGDTPTVGAERGIDRIRVYARLKGAGFTPDEYSITVPERAIVVRESQEIPHDRFRDVAIKAATTRYPGEWIEADATAPKPPVLVPTGEMELRAESLVRAEIGCSVTVGIYVDGRRFNSRKVVLQGAIAEVGCRAGSRVKLLVRSNGAVVELMAQAKKTARIGEQVDVQTADGSVLTGIVTQVGVVEVKL